MASSCKLNHILVTSFLARWMNGHQSCPCIIKEISSRIICLWIGSGHLHVQSRWKAKLNTRITSTGKKVVLSSAVSLSSFKLLLTSRLPSLMHCSLPTIAHNVHSILDQIDQEVQSIGRESRRLVSMQNTKALKQCDWKYCSCHDMRRRFHGESIWCQERKMLMWARDPKSNEWASTTMMKRMLFTVWDVRLTIYGTVEKEFKVLRRKSETSDQIRNSDSEKVPREPLHQYSMK